MKLYGNDVTEGVSKSFLTDCNASTRYIRCHYRLDLAHVVSWSAYDTTGGTKPAILETGAQVMVPLFLSVGEKIKVDTRNDSYLGRDN